MCEYCGCRGVPAIGELMDEHAELLRESHQVRAALCLGDRVSAATHLARLVGHLDRHVRREEAGIFTAMRQQGEFADEVAMLEGEHRDLHAAVGSLQPGAPDFEATVNRLFDDLAEHIEREDLGIFPVSVVSLGAAGWEQVERAREESPSFLTDHRESAMVIEPT